MSMQNFKLYILGTIITCDRKYIPPETKLLKFCRPNISKIMFLVSDNLFLFFWVSDLPFFKFEEFASQRIKSELLF